MRKKLIGLMCLVIVALSLAVNAKGRESSIEARVFKNEAKQTMPYRIFIPANYDPKIEYPLVVSLHGGGGKGTDNRSRGNHSFGVLSATDVQKKHPAFIITPQCPRDDTWANDSPKIDTFSVRGKPATKSITLATEIIRSVKNEFNIDPARIYVTGNSMGAAGTWDIILRNPKLFAAAIPTAGHGDPSMAKEIVHLPIWAFHGDNDRVVSPVGAKLMVDAIKKAGGKSIKYTEYPGVGHGAVGPAWQEKDIIPWLYSQKNKFIVPDKTIVYKTVKGKDNKTVELKLRVFNPTGHKADDKTPAIIFFFGGGWTGFNPEQFYKQSQYLALRGMVAICGDYRVKTSPKDCVVDAKSAIRWVRSHAKELGINPDMLAAGGGSAGGHVAAATGTVKGFNAPGEDVKTSCRPDALVLFNPVYDNSEKGYGYDRVKDYWKEFSPMHNIDKDTPATIVFLGSKDKLIPVETAREYKKLMEAAGVRSELHIYEGQKHGFFNSDKFYETLLETDKFLESLGYIKGEPTLVKPAVKL